MSANRLKLNIDKTELLGTGSRQHISTPWSWSIYTTGRRYCPSLRPCAVAWSNYIGWSEPRPPCVRRQFGVLLYWLLQLRRVCRSLDDKSAAILVHDFVTPRVDYCYLQSAVGRSLQSLRLPTSCSGSWTLQRELLATRKSTTAAWHTCFTLSYIGSMWQIVTYKIGLTVYTRIGPHVEQLKKRLKTAVYTQVNGEWHI